MYSKKSQNIFYIMNLFQFLVAFAYTYFFIMNCNLHPINLMSIIGILMLPMTTFYLYNTTKDHLNIGSDHKNERIIIPEREKNFSKKFGGIFLYVMQILIFIMDVGLLKEIILKGKTFCH